MRLGLALVASLAIAPDPIAPSIAASRASATPAASSTSAPGAPRARFDAARAALLAGDLATAQRGFDDVESDPSASPGLAEAARILAGTCADLAAATSYCAAGRACSLRCPRRTDGRGSR